MRLIQYNVHRFVSAGAAAGASTLPAIATALGQLAPDLLTLNEVDVAADPTCLDTLSSELGLPHVEFFGHVRGRYGNAVLSRYPLRRLASVHLEGGTEFEFPAGTRKLNGDVSKAGETHRIVRGMLGVDVQLAGDEGFTLACTHLDHMDIDQRKIQLRHALDELDKLQPDPATAVVFAGDLNALTRSDYSPDEWAHLEQRADRRGWQPPSTGDLDILVEHGFVDTAGRGDRRAKTAPAAEGASPIYRIDYVWLKQGAAAAAAADGDDDGGACTHAVAGDDGGAGASAPRLALEPLASFVAHEVRLSDHFPLVVDFEVRDANNPRRTSAPRSASCKL